MDHTGDLSSLRRHIFLGLCRVHPLSDHRPEGGGILGQVLVGHVHDFLTSTRIGRATFHRTNGGGHHACGSSTSHTGQTTSNTETLADGTTREQRADTFSHTRFQRGRVFDEARSTIDQTTTQIGETSHKAAVTISEVTLVLTLVVLSVEFSPDAVDVAASLLSRGLHVLHVLTEPISAF